MHRNLLTAILLFALILCLCSCSNEHGMPFYMYNFEHEITFSFFHPCF